LHEFKEFKLLYRMNDHKPISDAFHRQCNWRGNILTLISTNDGRIFGGFTPLPWNPPEGDYDCPSDPSGETFVFVVQSDPDPAKSCPPTKFMMNQDGKSTICRYAQGYGPIFRVGPHSIVVTLGSTGASVSPDKGGERFVGLSRVEALNGTDQQSVPVKELEIFAVTRST
jgi:hypothetical protein